MIVEIDSLGISQPIEDYSLVKELDANKIKRSFNADVRFKDAAYSLLLEQTLSGKGVENATATENCAADTVTIDCNILHNEGVIHHRSCQYSKKIFIKDPLTCIKDLEVNIFDYPTKTINSIQGTQLTYTYYLKKLKYLPEETLPDLNELLAFMGGIPAPQNAYTITAVSLSVVAKTIEFNDPAFGPYLAYAGHEIRLTVIYTRVQSGTKHSDLWLEVPGESGVYYFVGFPEAIWKAPLYEGVITSEINEPEPGIFQKDDVYYVNAAFSKGQIYPERDISNCVSFNALLEGVFTCAGLPLVSNFFGIDSDGTYPSNEIYQYANANIHNLYIAQSYDIIRESAIQDSFGVSGKLKAKKFIDSIMSLFNLLLIVDNVANVIRLEHVSYFSTKGINFVTNGKEYGMLDEIEVNRDIIGSEAWRFAAITPNGYETKITYDVLGDVTDKEYQIEQLLTDVFGTINNKDYEKDEYKKLFFLIQTDGSEIVDLNMQMYVNQLVKRFHYLNRPLPKGKHDGNDVSFYGFSIGLTTEVNYEGSIKDFAKFNPGNSIKVDNGTWLIQKMEYSKGHMKMGVKK